MSEKVALKIDKFTTRPDYCGSTKAIKYALPFYIAKAGKYVHRLRMANAHWRNGKLSHVSLSFWCGASGFMHRGRMFAEVPEGAVLCATCEGRAIGAGLEGARVINGRPVMYSPTRDSLEVGKA